MKRLGCILFVGLMAVGVLNSLCSAQDVKMDIPVITGTTPTNNSMGVLITDSIIVNFSTEMNRSTLKYELGPSNMDPGGWVQVWAMNNTSVELTHNNFSTGTDYYFNITGIQDMFNVSVPGLPYRIRFRTEISLGHNITILRPTTGDKWWWGSSQNISFTIHGGTAPYKIWINYSNDNGVSFSPILGAQALNALHGMNNYTWVIPSSGGPQCKIRINLTDANGEKHWATSSQFEIYTFVPDTSPLPLIMLAGTLLVCPVGCRKMKAE